MNFLPPFGKGRLGGIRKFSLFKLVFQIHLANAARARIRYFSKGGKMQFVDLWELLANFLLRSTSACCSCCPWEEPLQQGGFFRELYGVERSCAVGIGVDEINQSVGIVVGDLSVVGIEFEKIHQVAMVALVGFDEFNLFASIEDDVLIIARPLNIADDVRKAGDWQDFIFTANRLDIPLASKVDTHFVVIPKEQFFAIIGKLRAQRIARKLLKIVFIFASIVNIKVVTGVEKNHAVFVIDNDLIVGVAHVRRRGKRDLGRGVGAIGVGLINKTLRQLEIVKATGSQLIAGYILRHLANFSG